MDMWSWTYEADDDLRDAGFSKLANYMDRMPHDTVNGRHEKVDQYADEAIAMAREAGHPWVEIFLRHWRLQSTILHRQKPRDMIKEAVSLLEFAHREGNQDCPQSVCVVQDLANCYGAFDGPGFVDERIDVCKENFARINPSWSCYSCIGGEYARALFDGDRYQECIDFLDQCDRELVNAGESKDTGELMLVRILAHVRLGEFDKARKYTKIARNPMGGKSFANYLKVIKAYVEMAEKRYDEAEKKLPPFEQIQLHTTVHPFWAEVFYRCMVSKPAPVSSDDVDRVASIAEDMERRGTYRQALHAYGWLVDLYRRNADEQKASTALESMKRVQQSLNKDLGASELIASLE